MTILDTKLLPKIKKIVDTYGKVAVFTVQSATYDPTTGSTSYGAESLFTRKVTPPYPANRGLNGALGIDNIVEGKAKIYLPAYQLGFTPINGMQVDYDSKTWKIENVEEINTGELIGLYGLDLADNNVT